MTEPTEKPELDLLMGCFKNITFENPEPGVYVMSAESKGCPEAQPTAAAKRIDEKIKLKFVSRIIDRDFCDIIDAEFAPLIEAAEKLFRVCVNPNHTIQEGVDARIAMRDELARVRGRKP